ncbi:MAG TPA: hypothetical protein VFE47_07765 [Tepidisphaeraceae bacterium]|jgi:hypothetical protein|nr:hypothetical protein [Tepidisphaeraceae bacterium]
MCNRFSGMIESRIVRLALAGGALALGGCQPQGTVAGQGGQYTQYVMSLYNDPAAPHGMRTVEFPINIAAAQIGEAAPRPEILDTLRRSRDVFGRVESLPAQEEMGALNGGERNPIRRLQSMARDQGADYLLIFGATVETRTRVNDAAIMDLTIVGAYVPLSRDVNATARGSAALIDVRTGNVVLSAGAEAKQDKYASAATAEAVADEVSQAVHDESLSKLADQIIATAKRRAIEESAMDDVPIRQVTPTVAREK